MRRFFSKLLRFFKSWGFLKFVLWTATLIILFYVEEDWRGARAWAATKAKWEAKGESLDYTTFIPPPIPDAENLGALPLFKVEPNPKDPNYLEPTAFYKAMDNGHFITEPLQVYAGKWYLGGLPDMAGARRTLAKAYADAFPGVESPKDTLAQFDALFPFLSDLRKASATRPFCRFNLDYTIYPPTDRPYGLIPTQLEIAQYLQFHALLALNQGQPDVALTDLKVIATLQSGVERHPSSVGGLVTVALSSIYNGALCDGLALHAWNDAQLAGIQEMLGRPRLLADCQHAARADAATTSPNYDYFKINRKALADSLSALKEEPHVAFNMSPGNWRTLLNRWEIQLSIDHLLYLWPNGWIDQNKCQMVEQKFNCLGAVDPKGHRVFPEITDGIGRQVEQRKAQLNALAPWNIIFTNSAADSVFEFNAAQHFAYVQVRSIDEARMACALERYRLGHGVYPDSLDALVPVCIDELPTDIMNGEPYHYRLLPDGSFLLYSVGWNQKDDGGKVVFNEAGSLNYSKGDWVWPTPQSYSANSP